MIHRHSALIPISPCIIVSGMVLVSCHISGGRSRGEDSATDSGTHDPRIEPDIQDSEDPEEEIPVTCGDGIVDTGEACDDGNEEPWDGCNRCRIMEFRVNEITEGLQGIMDFGGDTALIQRFQPICACARPDEVFHAWYRLYDFADFQRFGPAVGILALIPPPDLVNGGQLRG